jgi:hypothetical protein
VLRIQFFLPLLKNSPFTFTFFQTAGEWHTKQLVCCCYKTKKLRLEFSSVANPKFRGLLIKYSIIIRSFHQLICVFCLVLFSVFVKTIFCCCRWIITFDQLVVDHLAELRYQFQRLYLLTHNKVLQILQPKILFFSCVPNSE